MKTFREAFKVVPREPTGDIAVPTCPLSGVVVTVTVAWSLDSPLQGLMRTESKKPVVTEWWVEEEGAGDEGVQEEEEEEWVSDPVIQREPTSQVTGSPVDLQSAASVLPLPPSTHRTHIYLCMYVCILYLHHQLIQIWFVSYDNC